MIFGSLAEASIDTFIVPSRRVFGEFVLPVDIGNVGLLGANIAEEDLESFEKGNRIAFPAYDHRRSFMFWSAPNLGAAALDQYGEKHFVATAKGAVFDPSLEKHDYETNGFRINGLQNAIDATAALIKSQYLRSIGIPVEWIFAIDMPTLLPDPNPASPQDKESLIAIDQFMKLVPGGFEFSSRFPEMTDAIDNFVPFISYRLQKSALRLWDLERITDKTMKTLSRNVFLDIAPTLLDNHFITEGDVATAAENVAEQNKILRDYFATLFPKLLGKAVGTFWREDFQHNFFHGGNVTLAGEIADTETVTGPFPWLPNSNPGRKVVDKPVKDRLVFSEIIKSFKLAYFLRDQPGNYIADAVNKVEAVADEAMCEK